MSTQPQTGTRVVIHREEMGGGAPMEEGHGVRDLKAIYPENGFATRTLILGIVEIDPGRHSPLHRHNCEEVYYVISGEGTLESDGEHHALRPGDAAYNREGVAHRVHCTGDEALRLVVVGGQMFVGLLPEWPTAGPYEILEDVE